MKKTAWFLSVGLLVAAAMMPGQASSHREAPLIAQDPTADNTDVYAFVDPNDPDMVTLIANFIPFQKPDGGPNFYPFDPNVRLRDPRRQQRRRGRGHHVPVALHDRAPQPGDVPLQHRPGHVASTIPT